jgi:hypothetical protein
MQFKPSQQQQQVQHQKRTLNKIQEKQKILNEYENELNELYKLTSKDENIIQRHLSNLRLLVLKHGVPEYIEDYKKIGSKKIGPREQSLRSRLYKAFLRIDRIDAEMYFDAVDILVEKQDYEIYTADAKRTFSKEEDFRQRVSNADIKRILNVFVVRRCGVGSKYRLGQGFSYPAAVFLYCMNEVEAFYCLERCASKLFGKLYVKDNNPDVMFAVCYAYGKLVEKIIGYFDKELYEELGWKNASRTSIVSSRAWISHYAFGFFCQKTAFDQVLKLFDFYLAFGFHTLVLIVAAVILEYKQDILSICKKYGKDDPSRDVQLFRILSNMEIKDASQIISVASVLMVGLPDHLLEMMEKLLEDDQVVKELLGDNSVGNNSNQIE